MYLFTYKLCQKVVDASSKLTNVDRLELLRVGLGMSTEMFASRVLNVASAVYVAAVEHGGMAVVTECFDHLSAHGLTEFIDGDPSNLVYVDALMNDRGVLNRYAAEVVDGNQQFATVGDAMAAAVNNQVIADLNDTFLAEKLADRLRIRELIVSLVPAMASYPALGPATYATAFMRIHCVLQRELKSSADVEAAAVQLFADWHAGPHELTLANALGINLRRHGRRKPVATKSPTAVNLSVYANVLTLVDDDAPVVHELLVHEPQVVQPQVVQPQAVQPQAVQPQVVQPQVVQPQVVQPQVVQPQVVQPQVVQPQVVQPQVDADAPVEAVDYDPSADVDDVVDALNETFGDVDHTKPLATELQFAFASLFSGPVDAPVDGDDVVDGRDPNEHPEAFYPRLTTELDGFNLDRLVNHHGRPGWLKLVAAKFDAVVAADTPVPALHADNCSEFGQLVDELTELVGGEATLDRVYRDLAKVVVNDELNNVGELNQTTFTESLRASVSSPAVAVDWRFLDKFTTDGERRLMTNVLDGSCRPTLTEQLVLAFVLRVARRGLNDVNLAELTGDALADVIRDDVLAMRTDVVELLATERAAQRFATLSLRLNLVTRIALRGIQTSAKPGTPAWFTERIAELDDAQRDQTTVDWVQDVAKDDAFYSVICELLTLISERQLMDMHYALTAGILRESMVDTDSSTTFANSFRNILVNLGFGSELTMFDLRYIFVHTPIITEAWRIIDRHSSTMPMTQIAIAYTLLTESAHVEERELDLNTLAGDVVDLVLNMRAGVDETCREVQVVHNDVDAPGGVDVLRHAQDELIDQLTSVDERLRSSGTWTRFHRVDQRATQLPLCPGSTTPDGPVQLSSILDEVTSLLTRLTPRERSLVLSADGLSTLTKLAHIVNLDVE